MAKVIKIGKHDSSTGWGSLYKQYNLWVFDKLAMFPMNAYLYLKPADPFIARKVLNAKTPIEAIQIASKCDTRPNWDKIKDDVLRHVLRNVFFYNPEAQQALLETGDSHIEEQNSRDNNLLGVMLMAVRDDLKTALSLNPKAKNKNFFDALLYEGKNKPKIGRIEAFLGSLDG